MACLTPVTIRIDTPTGPLNSAAYEPNRDKIFAVRDNWIYQLNATTGAKEAEYRFVNTGIPGDSYIDYDTTTDTLWATFWRSTPDGNGTTADGKYLVEIDPDDITAVTLHAFTAGMSVGAFAGWDSGPRQIIARSGIGFMLFSTGAEPPQTRIARIDLSIPSVTHTNSISIIGASSTWGSIHHDGTNLIWAANTGTDACNIRNPANLANLGLTDSGDGTTYSFGVTSSAVGTNYFCCGSQFIVKATNAGGVGTVLDLGRPDANPHNIRYSTPLNLIYIPLYKDDTIAVLNPADDSFEIKTGFTQPWDVVTTAARVFALQHAAIGIKEIT